MQSVKKYSLTEFRSNPQIFGSSERFLHLVIECAIDIGNHIISDLRLRKPDSNREIFEILHENKLINDELRDSLCKMAQFRNILVHDYLKIDREIVFNILQRNLSDLERFVVEVIQGLC